MVYQYRVNWNGTTGGPGVSVFSTLSGPGLGQYAQTLADSTRAFFDAIKALIPNEVTWSFPGEVQEYNTVTGQLSAAFPVTPPANVAATASAGYAHASGVRVDWETGSIVNGRRFRGRTFLVPSAAAIFDTAGLLSATHQTTLQTAGNNLITALTGTVPLCVWSRTHGIAIAATSCKVERKGSVLRSRRD